MRGIEDLLERALLLRLGIPIVQPQEGISLSPISDPECIPHASALAFFDRRTVGGIVLKVLFFDRGLKLDQLFALLGHHLFDLKLGLSRIV